MSRSRSLVPDGVFVADKDWLAFALHPVATMRDVVAILDWIVHRLRAGSPMRRATTAWMTGVDVLVQVHAEAAAT